MDKRIYLCLAHMSGKEMGFIQEAFDTNWVVPLGPNVSGFEQDLEAFVGENKHVVALSAGTAAVHLALVACGVGQGDEVMVQSFTFCASSHPMTYLGATPVFVDSEGDTWNMDPQLLEADADAEYAAVIDIDLADIKEPILCAPNDPDDARLLSDVQGDKIDEVFIGSCMTNIGHFRAAGKLLDTHKGQLPTRLWVAPPTRMDAAQLTEEGYYSVFGKSGARIEIPGCSLCMGNQARVADGATVVSTSTRNFPNRLGTGANVYLASAELAAVAALIGKLPTPEEYQTFVAQVDKTAVDTYRYLNFDQLSQYTEKADGVIFQTAV